MSKAPPFDQAILDKAKAKFIEELRLDIATIQANLQPGAHYSKEETAKIFHKIKGASGFLGMTSLESMCSELIKALRSGSTDNQQLHQMLSDWVDLSKDICNKS
jgi:HPt (histidine-containing phosphotransfer) domain-containing protein